MEVLAMQSHYGKIRKHSEEEVRKFDELEYRSMQKKMMGRLDKVI